MATQWPFYVYEIMDGGRVVYVGKGSGRRCFVSAKERGGRAVILAHFRHPEWALAFERERIAERLAEGCVLKNVAYGVSAPWGQRTDTQAMAREVLEWFAARIGCWINAGRVEELGQILRMEKDDLVAIHQRFAL